MGQKGDSIILIGMPGCGKSTVGVVLAKALGMNFIDTDLLISSRYGLTLQEIIDVRGLETFLAYEEQAGLSVCDRRAVIATGGSMVFSGKAMEHLSGLGTVVYLDVGLQDLEERLTNIRTRGVASRPGETLADIYRARTPLYETYAELRIPVSDHAHLEEVVECLAVQLGGHK